MAENKSDPGTDMVPAIDQKLIDESVTFINDTIVKTIYKGSLEIGKYLLEKFFKNDIKLASSRNPRKSDSFQQLCKRPDLKVDPTTLSRMVRVASQEEYLIQNKVATDDLFYSHKLGLIKLPNDQKKLDLIKRCIKEKLSTRTLAKIIAETRKEIPSTIERSPLKLLSNIDSSIEKANVPTLLLQHDKLAKMKSKTRTKTKESAESILEKVATLTKNCKTLIKDLDKIEVKKEKEQEAKEKKKQELLKNKATKKTAKEKGGKKTA
jgi:hypothetical protein